MLFVKPYIPKPSIPSNPYKPSHPSHPSYYAVIHYNYKKHPFLIKADMDKSVLKVIKVLRKNGWQVDVELNKHYKAVISKENFKSPTIVFASTPSDKNAVRNIVKDFRKAVKAGGFDTLDNYHSYFITECEFDDVLDAVAERLTHIADAGGIYEEAIGHIEILRQVFNVSQDGFFTEDKEAVEEWENFRRRNDN